MARYSLLGKLYSAHTVSVQTYQGTNGLGQSIYAPAVNVVGFLDDQRKVVLAKDGAEAISEATFTTDVSFEPTFEPESLVTLPDGRTAKVIRSNATDTAGLAKRAEHVAVSLT